jgi:hypothetical protein
LENVLHTSIFHDNFKGSYASAAADFTVGFQRALERARVKPEEQQLN